MWNRFPVSTFLGLGRATSVYEQLNKLVNELLHFDREELIEIYLRSSSNPTKYNKNVLKR